VEGVLEGVTAGTLAGVWVGEGGVVGGEAEEDARVGDEITMSLSELEPLLIFEKRFSVFFRKLMLCDMGGKEGEGEGEVASDEGTLSAEDELFR
jgi:hypothetical protein